MEERGQDNRDRFENSICAGELALAEKQKKGDSYVHVAAPCFELRALQHWKKLHLHTDVEKRSR